MKKKLSALALAGFMFASAGLTFSAAMAVNDKVLCNRNHVLCRDYSLDLDAPWYQERGPAPPGVGVGLFALRQRVSKSGYDPTTLASKSRVGRSSCK